VLILDNGTIHGGEAIRKLQGAFPDCTSIASPAMRRSSTRTRALAAREARPRNGRPNSQRELLRAFAPSSPPPPVRKHLRGCVRASDLSLILR